MLATVSSDEIVILGRDRITLDHYEHEKGNEVWAMGHHREAHDYATRIFEAHEEAYVLKQRHRATYLAHWLEKLEKAAQEKPVYTLHPWRPLGPYHCHLQPNDKLNVHGKPYIESSIGYMLACCLNAINHGIANVKKIRLYGVSFNVTPEYAYQRPNSMYYVGRLEQAGVTFEFPSVGCKIFDSAWKTGIYGLVDNLTD